MSKVTVITTNKRMNQYWEVNEHNQLLQQEVECIIQIDLQKKKQVIEGFGGTFTGECANSYSHLTKDEQNEVIKAYFSEEGLGYNVGHIYTENCDFSLRRYTYSNQKQYKNEKLERQYDQIIPMIRAAQEEAWNDIKFIGSPCEPPIFMKMPKLEGVGGTLKKEYYKILADYIVYFIGEYEEVGIPIQYITLQDQKVCGEIGKRFGYTKEDEINFIQEYLKPALQEACMNHINPLVFNRVEEVEYDILEQFNHVKKQEINLSEEYIEAIKKNFELGNSIFINDILVFESEEDVEYEDSLHDPTIYKKEEELKKNLTYYYMGHISKYVQRGAQLIEVCQNENKMVTMVFINPNQERVVVVLNKSEDDISISLQERAKEVVCSVVEARSITTFVYK